MKHTWKKTAAGLLAMALVVGAMPANVGTGGFFGGTEITAYAAETIESGTKGSLSWTFDDEGTLLISGSGEVPEKAFWNANWGNASKVKKLITAEDSTISKFGDMAYACYSSNTTLSEVEINTTVPLTLVKNAFFYRSNNAVNFTINAPEIAEIEQEVIYDYSDNAVNMVFNVEKPIKFYKNTFTCLSSNSTFTIPLGSVIYSPAGYVFRDSYYQMRYDEMVAWGEEQFFWNDYGDELTEGIDYTYNDEATSELITADNASSVFGDATVKFIPIYTKVEAKEPTVTEPGNTEYYEGSDGKYYEKNGNIYTEIEEGSWVIPAIDTTLETGKTYKQTASKDEKYYTRFVFVKPKSEIEGKSKAKFTAHYNGTDYSFETTSYYTGMTSNGISYTLESEDSVMFVVTITSGSDISADLTCDIDFE